MDDLVSYEHQVAGWHNGSLSCVLKNKKGQILKPVKLNANPTYDELIKRDKEKETSSEELIPVCRDERAFYEMVSASTKPDDVALKALIPKYYGCQEVEKEDGSCTPHLILEDLAYGLGLPCVMDIKVGVSQDYPNKGKVISKTKTKYATQESHGFCLTGARVFHPVKGRLTLDLRPDACKRLTASQVFNVLRGFSQLSFPASKQLCESLVEGLLSIKNWILEQRSYKIRRGSILILYEAGDVSDGSVPTSIATSCTDNKEETPKKFKVVVKMIDFAHVFQAFGEQDDNYLEGLNNLIDFFGTCKHQDENEYDSGIKFLSTVIP
ncbi:uncharacterized protein Ipk2 [Palaemon carinicauda]|uniref:uncharacterized protein Ipk2 n=1 Tax=Palaemon carinicauda TaxID=392227 RepID=UPI0035B6334C